MSPVKHKNIALVGKAAIRERTLMNPGRLLLTHNGLPPMKTLTVVWANYFS